MDNELYFGCGALFIALKWHKSELRVIAVAGKDVIKNYWGLGKGKTKACARKRQTHRHTDSQTHRHTHRHTHRQTDNPVFSDPNDHNTFSQWDDWI